MNNAVNTTIINSYIEANKLSKAKFCKLCKISIYAFNKIMTGQDFDIINIFRIAKAMNIRVCELFRN